MPDDRLSKTREAYRCPGCFDIVLDEPHELLYDIPGSSKTDEVEVVGCKTNPPHGWYDDD